MEPPNFYIPRKLTINCKVTGLTDISPHMELKFDHEYALPESIDDEGSEISFHPLFPYPGAMALLRSTHSHNNIVSVLLYGLKVE